MRRLLKFAQQRARFLVELFATPWHKTIALTRWSASAYFALVSWISRNCLPASAALRVGQLVTGGSVVWPRIAFAPRSVFVGASTKIQITPHLGEFDQGALFQKMLDYEQPVFRWLEQNAAASYDLVIEIGANVGVYSVFLDTLIKARLPGTRLKQVVSFEPALEPFRRLIENLRANHARFVIPFQVAISDRTEFRSFFQPPGHLTNGSLIEGFAKNFSDTIEKTIVVSLGVRELEYFFCSHARVLVKLDSEGHEPIVAAAFKDIVLRYRPDFLIEVLAGTAELLEKVDFLATYQRYLIGPNGLQSRAKLAADSHNRDWLLRPQSRH